MRLIDAGELKESVQNVLKGHKHSSISKAEVEYLINHFVIDEAPTIDAIPIIHAHWMHTGGFHTKRCSHCGYVSTDIGKYCSECSAIMDEEKK